MFHCPGCWETPCVCGKDPDNPELDDDFFRRARPAAEVMPAIVGAEEWERMLTTPGNNRARKSAARGRDMVRRMEAGPLVLREGWDG